MSLEIVFFESIDWFCLFFVSFLSSLIDDSHTTLSVFEEGSIEKVFSGKF